MWISLLTGATERIDLFGYAYPFVLELLPITIRRLTDKAAAGARNRSAFADPDSAQDVLEPVIAAEAAGTSDDDA